MLIYQVLKPIYSEIDPNSNYSLEPLDLAHCEIIYMDNNNDFCFE